MMMRSSMTLFSWFISGILLFRFGPWPWHRLDSGHGASSFFPGGGGFAELDTLGDHAASSQANSTGQALSGAWPARALAMPSCTSGFPLELEKRITVGTACPCRCGARLTARADAEPRNVPEQTRPLA
jgi:hypothetical protein